MLTPSEAADRGAGQTGARITVQRQIVRPALNHFSAAGYSPETSDGKHAVAPTAEVGNAGPGDETHGQCGRIDMK